MISVVTDKFLPLDRELRALAQGFSQEIVIESSLASILVMTDSGLRSVATNESKELIKHLYRLSREKSSARSGRIPGEVFGIPGKRLIWKAERVMTSADARISCAVPEHVQTFPFRIADPRYRWVVRRDSELAVRSISVDSMQDCLQLITNKRDRIVVFPEIKRIAVKKGTRLESVSMQSGAVAPVLQLFKKLADDPSSYKQTSLCDERGYSYHVALKYKKAVPYLVFSYAGSERDDEIAHARTNMLTWTEVVASRKNRTENRIAKLMGLQAEIQELLSSNGIACYNLSLSVECNNHIEIAQIQDKSPALAMIQILREAFPECLVLLLEPKHTKTNTHKIIVKPSDEWLLQDPF